MSNEIPGVRAMHDVEGYKNVIEDYTGSRPSSCPWSAFSNPIVVDVMRVRPLMESGQAHLLLGDRPPAVLVDALAEHESVINRVQAKQWRKKQAEREVEQRAAKAKNNVSRAYSNRGRRG